MTPRKTLKDDRLNLKLPAEVKARLRKQADENNLTMSSLALIILIKHQNSSSGRGVLRFYESTRNTE